jgi:hypothetical protein
VKGAKKTVLKIFIFCVFIPFGNYAGAIALASGAANNPGHFLAMPDSNSNKPQHTAACMNFGDQLGYGQITLGLRTGICALFDPNSIGYGIGAQMRIRLSKKWNLELYTDYFQTSIMNLGYRHEIDFGGNLLYYWTQRPLIPYKLTPFLLGGLSYANNNIRSYNIYTAAYEIWSPWLNLGLGEHYLFSPRFDITLEAYYSIPLAVHPVSYLANGIFEKNQILPRQYLNVKDEGAFHPGGIFVILSFNYTFGNI